MTRMLEDKVIIVTGAGGGIGRDFALAAAREGAKVVVNDIGTSTQSVLEHALPALRGSCFPLRRSGDAFSWDPV